MEGINGVGVEGGGETEGLSDQRFGSVRGNRGAWGRAHLKRNMTNRFRDLKLSL